MAWVKEGAGLVITPRRWPRDLPGCCCVTGPHRAWVPLVAIHALSGSRFSEAHGGAFADGAFGGWGSRIVVTSRSPRDHGSPH